MVAAEPVVAVELRVVAAEPVVAVELRVVAVEPRVVVSELRAVLVAVVGMAVT